MGKTWTVLVSKLYSKRIGIVARFKMKWMAAATVYLLRHSVASDEQYWIDEQDG